MARVHVVGAGLAGLAAGLDLRARGHEVVVHEASGAAGGRCRSFHDAALGCVIDNGNHLILSGNGAVLDHAARLGAADRLRVLEPVFPFADLSNGARWTIRLPGSALGALRRDALPPGATRARMLLDLLGLLRAGRGASVADAVRGRGAMWRGFWDPLATAVLNAPPEEGSAALLRAALLRTFGRGAAAARPVIAPDGLGAALIEPAAARLDLRLREPLQRIEARGGRAVALVLNEGEVPLGPEDGVVLALPPTALAKVWPEAGQARPGLAILNAHFRMSPRAAAGVAPITGVLGGSAQWIFARGDVLSVTVSAAERTPVWGMEREAALDRLWAEVASALGLHAAPLARRLLRERAATFDQSAGGAALRPGFRTALANVVLAGDHVATGLPATLEGAVLSGRRAAALL
jgi:hydroxysqualene dehydroxylase